MHKNTFEVINVCDLDKTGLDDSFLNGHYLQSLKWCKSIDHSFYAVSYKNNVIVATSVISFKKLPLLLGSICYINRGPVGETESDIINHNSDLIKYLSKHNVVFVMCSPMVYTEKHVQKISDALTSAGWRTEHQTLSLYKSTLVIDLSLDLEVVRSKFRRSLKTQLNKSEKLGIDINLDPEDSAIKDFFKYFNSMAEERGLSIIDSNMMKFIFDAKKRNEAKIVLAYVQDRLISGIILMKQDDRIIYEWGMNTQEPEFKSLPLAHKMHWEAIKWAKNDGYSIYDFGGYWLDRGNNDPINYFKLGFTKNVQIVTPEFYYVLQPLKYYLMKILNNIRKALKS